jgi:pimeloyl-ACP methyl ester carboxylesterase
MASTELDRELRAAQEALLAHYAPEAQSRAVAWSGGETQVIEVGEGPPLLLLHGGGDGAFEWVPILAPLAKARRVIAVDRPGHGLADAFSYRDVDLLEHVQTFVGDVLDSLGLESTDILANSIGGYWAAVFALASPAKVKRMVVAGVPPGLTREAPFPMRLMGLPLVGGPLSRALIGKPSREGSRKFWGELLVVHHERLSDELMDADAAHMRRNATDVIDLVRLLIGPRGVRREFVLGDRWAAVEVPLLLLYGESDKFMTHGMAQAWESIAAANPLVRILRVPGAGHLPWIDEPERVVLEVERFLALGFDDA